MDTVRRIAELLQIEAWDILIACRHRHAWTIHGPFGGAMTAAKASNVGHAEIPFGDAIEMADARPSFIEACSRCWTFLTTVLQARLDRMVLALTRYSTYIGCLKD